MIHSIGVGLAFTVCVIVQVVALIGVAVQWRYGGQWRLEAERHSINKVSRGKTEG
jgi:hypothetical protein